MSERMAGYDDVRNPSCRCQHRPGAVCTNTADGPDGHCGACRFDGGDGHPNRQPCDCPNRCCEAPCVGLCSCQCHSAESAATFPYGDGSGFGKTWGRWPEASDLEVPPDAPTPVGRLATRDPAAASALARSAVLHRIAADIEANCPCAHCSAAAGRLRREAARGGA